MNIKARKHTVAPPRGGFKQAPFPICFTPEALDELQRTVASRPPESGAKGFGPKDLMGFDVVEFDARGSKAAGGTVYSPDVEWGTRRVEFWLDQPDDNLRLWTGDIHSHPGSFERPSIKVGVALGDLGYVEEVFASNEWMEWFAIPILTNTGLCNGGAQINGWWVSRRDPLQPLQAEVVECNTHDFPPRVFNPEWEAQVEAGVLPLDVDLLQQLLCGIELTWEEVEGGTTFAITLCPTQFRLHLPTRFPQYPPELAFWNERGGWEKWPISHWSPISREALEVRVQRLLRYARFYLTRKL